MWSKQDKTINSITYIIMNKTHVFFFETPLKTYLVFES